MKQISSKLQNADLKNKRVFLRADLNVPIKDDKIIDDYRIKKLQPMTQKCPLK